jgi:hypothetical protein
MKKRMFALGAMMRGGRVGMMGILLVMFTGCADETGSAERPGGGHGGGDSAGGAGGAVASVATVSSSATASSSAASGSGGSAATSGSSGQGGEACASPWATCSNHEDGDPIGSCVINLDFDSQHCGSCMATCELALGDYGLCAKGTCADKLDTFPVSIARDATHVYWLVEDVASPESYFLRRAPLAGGAAELVTETGFLEGGWSTPPALAVDQTSVYFTEVFGGGNRIYKAPKSGGAASVLCEDDGLGADHPAIISDGTHVYWLTEIGIYRAPVAGGSSELWFKRVCLERLWLDGQYAVFSCGDDISTRQLAKPPSDQYINADVSISANGLASFAADATHFWWTTVTEIRRAPKAGGASTAVLNAGAPIVGLGLDSTSLHFSIEDATGHWQVVMTDKSGAGPIVPIAGDHWFTPYGQINLIATDDRVILPIWADGLFSFQK